MFLHTFYTWVIANLLHPILILLALHLMCGETVFGDEFIRVYITAFIYSIVISVPCLLAGWFCVYLVSTIPLSVEAKFLIWLTIAPSLVFFEIFIILLVTGYIEAELLLYSIPGMAATGIAILSRYKQFQKIISINKTTNHETNLV